MPNPTPGTPRKRRRCSSLRLIIERASHQEKHYYRANLQHAGVAFIVGGRMQRPEAFMVQAARIQELRHTFERQVQEMHAWAERGLDRDISDMQQMVTLGHAVGEVLPLSIRHGIATAVQRAKDQQQRLHITLEVAADAQEILAVPWELLWLPAPTSTQAGEQGSFVLLDAQVSLVRQVRGVGRNTPVRLTLPLTLHAFVASPQHVPPIDVHSTRHALGQVLTPEVMQQCWYQDTETLTQMQQRLGADQPQLVHIICHGYQKSTGRDRRNDLLLTWHDGLPHRVNAFTLATVLSLDPTLQLVMLQACHAGASELLDRTNDTNSDSAEEMQRRSSEGTALTLIRHGVPVVVAMQGAVGQAAAGAFAAAFYATLNQGGSVEEAVAHGRIRMLNDGGIVDWSLPVMYQGGGLPFVVTWYDRLADRVTAGIFDPVINRHIRGLGVLLSLVLLATSAFRWLAGIPNEPPAPDAMVTPLIIWTIMGVLCPFIIGATYRGARDRDDLPPDVRRATIVGQWVGAFLGYILGGVMGLGLLAITWILGVLAWRPWLSWLLGGGVLLWAAFTSYAQSRMQEQSAFAVSEVDTTLYDRFTAALIIVVTLLFILSPWLLYRMAWTPWAVLLTPPALALILSLFLLLMLLLWTQ